MKTTFKAVATANSRISVERLASTILEEVPEKPKALLSYVAKLEKAHEAIGKNIISLKEKAEGFAETGEAPAKATKSKAEAATSAKGRGRPKKAVTEVEAPAKKTKKVKKAEAEEAPAKKTKKVKKAEAEEAPAKKKKKVKSKK